MEQETAVGSRPRTSQEVLQLRVDHLQKKIERLSKDKPTEAQALALGRAKASLIGLQGAMRKSKEEEPKQ